MLDAFEALERICRTQGIPLEDAIRTDSAQTLSAALGVSNLEGLVRELDVAPIPELTVEVHLVSGTETAAFTRTVTGAWRLNADADVAIALPDADIRDTWASAELLSVTNTMPVAVELRLDKLPLVERQESLFGCSCWVGYSEETFTAWLRSRGWRQIGRSLFERPPGLVLLFKWDHEAVHIGDILTVASFEGVTVDPVETRWPEPAEQWVVATALLTVPPVLDRPWARPLAGTAGAAAASLLRDASRRGMALTDALPLAWEIKDTYEVDPERVSATIALTRWVAEDPTPTRLAISTRVAAERLPDPFAGPPPPPLIEAAEIAHRVVVDRTVREALARQSDLEEAFREMDSKVADTRAGLMSAIETVVTRALAAVLATTVAAITSSEITDALIVTAAGLIVLYVLYVAIFGMSTHKDDLIARVDGFEELVRQRRLGLGEGLRAELAEWRRGVEKRVRGSRVALSIVALAVAVAAVVGVTTTRPGAESEDGSSNRKRSADRDANM